MRKNMKLVETKFFTAQARIQPVLERGNGVFFIRRPEGCDPVHAAHTVTYDLG